MLRNLLLTLSLLTTLQVQAAYQCSTTPQDDIAITAQAVTVAGKQGTMIITRQGEITLNGKTLAPTAAIRQQAIAYQAAIRQEMPWINQGARQRLEQASVDLDKIVTEKLGAQSGVHQRLASLKTQLNQQLDKVISSDNGNLTFHHNAIEQVHKDSEKLVQSAMGGVLQDSLNEIGNMKNITSGENPLQALVGNLGGLQQSIQQKWKQHENDFEQFGHQVCQRVTKVDAQRQALLSAIQ